MRGERGQQVRYGAGRRARRVARREAGGTPDRVAAVDRRFRGQGRIDGGGFGFSCRRFPRRSEVPPQLRLCSISGVAVTTGSSEGITSGREGSSTAEGVHSHGRNGGLECGEKLIIRHRGFGGRQGVLGAWRLSGCRFFRRRDRLGRFGGFGSGVRVIAGASSGGNPSSASERMGVASRMANTRMNAMILKMGWFFVMGHSVLLTMNEFSRRLTEM